MPALPSCGQPPTAYGAAVSTPLTGRSGTPDDHDGALAVWRAVRAAAGRRPSAEQVAQFREQLAGPEALLAVLERGTDLVAMALGEPGIAQQVPVPGLLQVPVVCTHPDHRRVGAGTAVLEQLADEAWVRGYRRLQVRVPTEDAAATAFWTSCGLEPDAAMPAEVSPVRRFVAELAPPVRVVAVRPDGLRLGQLLKLAGLADTGTQARLLVVGGRVLVNGEVDTRRGRQLADGDVVEVDGVGAVRIDAR